MARLPAELIERIKTEVSLLRLVESQGYAVKRQGKDYALSCPFHADDDTPSLIISPQSNLFNCFGCGAAGSVIDWVMKTRGISFRHAAEILQQDIAALAAPQPTDKPAKHSRKQQLEVLLSTDAQAQTLLNQVIDYYHETLKQSPEALNYLESRGLGDRELIDRFKLGCANRTLGYRLPRKNTKAGDQLRGQLEAVGIYRESGHEHLNGSLVVPVFNREGNVVEVYGRKLRDDLRKGTPKHLYLPGPHAGVWNGEGLDNQKEVILCEALIDAMTFWVAGYRNVTASYGTSGFTDDHVRHFKRCGIERVLIAYDRDEAGNRAAEALSKKLTAEGFECYRLHFPKGMDANQYALEVTPASKSLGVVIRSAEWMGEGQAPDRSCASLRPRHTVRPEHKMQTGTAETADECLPPTVETETPEPSALVAEPLAAGPPTPEPETPPAESPPLPASVVPPAPVEPVEQEVSDHEITLRFGDRKYRVRGLQKNSSYEVLKVNVLVNCGEALHVDTFDLYAARHRQAFARAAAAECAVKDRVIQRDLGQVLLQLESLQDRMIQEALKPKEPTGYTMEKDERESALALLRDPNLAERIVTDFAKTGLVGEPANALMGYLAAVSRKLKSPLAVIVQSTSAAGKSALMDAVLKLVPEEDRVHYSAMTGQSLFYLGETNLKHKILGIAEEEGVRQAAYALKLLQSQGELTIASTGKDPQSGKLVTEEYRVEGPVMLFLTTTAIDIDEELLNRCVVLTIDESRDQTAAIQARQRQARTLSGLLASREADQIIRQHQNAQRLLRPLAVVNPYAEQLRFADGRTRTRRDHEKYLTLIDSIALLHQHQRDVKKAQQGEQVIEYVEVHANDIALANRLAHDILGRSLDELPPPTRRLLQTLHTLVAEKIKAEGLRQNQVRFTRRDVREAVGLSDKQVRVHLDRLVELEYVFAHRGKSGQRFIYELVFDGEPDSAQPRLSGLIDVEQLKNTTTTDNLVASKANLVPSSWPASGQVVGTSCPTKNAANPELAEVPADNGGHNRKTHCSPETNNELSYVQAVVDTSSLIPLTEEA